MKPAIHKSESGIALIMVLLVTAMLGMLAAAFAYTMKVETQLARNATFDAEMECAGRSAISRARWLISLPGGPGGRPERLKVLSQPWAGGTGDTNSPAMQFPLSYQFGNAQIDLKIVDCDRKININAVLALPPPADHDLMFHILRNVIGVEGDQAELIIGALKDWRDVDDLQNSSMGGAESDDYAINPNPGYPPYIAKNGAIDDLSELLMVRGITPAIYWGSAYRSHWQPPRMRGAGSALDEPTYAVGMVDLFTAFSSGKVNIHTISPSSPIGEALLPGMGDWFQSTILGTYGRAGPDGIDGTQDDMVFRSVPPIGFGPPGAPGPVTGGKPLMNLGPNRPMGGGMPGGPGFNPMLPGAMLLGVDSLYFEATAKVQLGGRSRTYIALLGPAPGRRGIQVLSLYWK